MVPAALDYVLADPVLTKDVREHAGLSERQQVSWRVAHEYRTASYLLDSIDARSRPNWTVLATDVWGLPWWWGERSISHGTWAKHDPCGTIQLLKAGRVECRRCPPEPDSRTNRARQDDPHLLYLVRYRRLLKFGHGDELRIKAHVRAGAEVVQVVRARHEDVIKAELRLRARHRGKIRPLRRGMPTTFGTGTEVVPACTPIDLTKVLDGDDVTHRFDLSDPT